MTDWISIAAGLVILTLGAELLIRGATALARRFGLSELLIGLTLVGFGTSTPELVSSVQASLLGAAGVAVGNVVGSNIANILLILALSALLAPIPSDARAFRRDAPTLAFATVLAALVALTGSYGRLAGAGFLLTLAAYIALAYVTERAAPDSPETQRHKEEAAALPTGPRSLLLDIVMAGAGLGLLMVGAKLLVAGAIAIAGALGVSDAIIGLSVVAIGTSLPELATSIMAALRGRSALALGNVVGSNIYNLLGILGVTALVAPVAVPAQIMRVDMWVMLAATAAMIFFTMTRNRIERWEGGALLAGYAAYVGWLIASAG
ncbi:MAG: calcium/sodium antiporter [Amphiplicatus sp.]